MTDKQGIKRGAVTDRIARLWDDARVRVRDANGNVSEDNLKASRDMLQSVADAFTSPDGRPYRVVWNKAAGIAFSDQRERLTQVNPAPLFDRSISADEAKHVLTAELAHECTHDRYWRGYTKALDEAFGANGPLRERAHVYDNLLQDVAGERRFEAEYPGMAGIFEPVIEYVGTRWPHPTPMAQSSRIDQAISAVRYAPWRDWSGIEAERDWWQEWADRVTAKPLTPSRMVAAITEAMIHEQYAPEQQPQQGDGKGGEGSGEPGDGEGDGGGQPGEGEPKGKGKGQGGKGQPKPSEGQDGQGDGKDEGDGEGDGQSDGDTGTDGSQATTSKAPGLGVGKLDPSRFTSKPTEAVCAADKVADESRHLDTADLERLTENVRGYVERPDRSRWPKVPLTPNGRVVSAVAAAFQRSRTGTTGYERGYRSGILDNRSLDRLATSDYHIFGRRISPEPGRYSVYIMLDTSGSMFGGYPPRPVDKAAEVAAAIAQAARNQSNLRLMLNTWGSGDVCKVWTTGDPLTWIAGTPESSQYTGGGTNDAAAMAWASKHINAHLRPGEQPIVFMLSDGYGFPDALRIEVAKARKAGVTVIGVAMSDIDLTSVYGKDYWVPWHGSISEIAKPISAAIAKAVNPAYGRGE